MSHSEQFLNDVTLISANLMLHSEKALEDLVDRLYALRERGGRLFFLGNGGSAANCSHAVNDFRKLAGIQAFTATDNVAELTARINDQGWHSSFVDWLRCSFIGKNDAVFVLSVGGGDLQSQISTNIVYAVSYALSVGAKAFGIVGRENGWTAEHATLCITVPIVNVDLVTPYTESFQSVLLHLIVTHPKFASNYSEKNTEKGLGR